MGQQTSLTTLFSFLSFADFCLIAGTQHVGVESGELLTGML